MINRRVFLKSTGMALVGGGFLPNVFVRIAEASQGAARRKTLVVVFQRGAVDGLNVVVPWFERDYYRARPTIAVAKPGSERGVIDLDGRFGLHPELEPLSAHWKNRSLAFVHASGSPDATRSHFDAQDFMESGTPGRKSTRDGFLARALERNHDGSPLRAVSITPNLPRILSGGAGAISVSSLDRFGVRAGRASASVSHSFESMYAGAIDQGKGEVAADSFEAARLLDSIGKIAPRNGARYPRGTFGDGLKQLAHLIRADVGLEVGFVDVGGWDTHTAQGGADGRLARGLRSWGEALHAFAVDLGDRMGDVVVVSVSEFGRTVAENGNRGTDHGHGNVITILGGGVRGGAVYGRWPGLSRGELYDGRDLAVTTDFRDVMGEIISGTIGSGDLDLVFPGYRADRTRWPGVI